MVELLPYPSQQTRGLQLQKIPSSITVFHLQREIGLRLSRGEQGQGCGVQLALSKEQPLKEGKKKKYIVTQRQNIFF